MPTYRLDIAYDGTGFHGYAKQSSGLRTVQGSLEAALTKLTGPVETVVAGRTDAGVHAVGQVVSFTTSTTLEEDRVVRSLNGQLGEEIAVNRCGLVPNDFSARFSASSRSYRYRVLARPVHDPLLRHVVWHVPPPLALDPMREAARHFVGEHDFASLCRSAEGRGTTREVLEADWLERGEGELEYQVSATSFCHQMVRSMVAVCVEVGRGKLDADEVPRILAARRRDAGRGAAPPQGLVLWEVTYG